ncbi:alcohol dehydrogenase [Venustampulla echinocandica]|uniref:Alcohol dehydrogenase n=1 Tax=Venustampulla echinocandica TaxID=2656787 RepID=A0A370T8R6_9HELO|nr:alcohol dehydrogenase [Venustampulla echinocandica]RDL29809.1 alcohol dehydrogenase [Venustampulla echinocandica]
MTGPPIPSTMFAWRKYKGNQEPVYEEIPVPPTPATGFLVKILAAGGKVYIDSPHIIPALSPFPPELDFVIPGHEGCGEIVRVGSEVQDSKHKLGDIVAIYAVPGCGSKDCPECGRDLPHLCRIGEHHGIGQDGSFADYIAIDARAAVALPKGVSPAEGAVATDAGTTAYSAIVKRGKITKDQTVVLFGLGGLGFNALQVILWIGARVIISDTRESTLEEAAKLGVPRKDIVPVGKSVQEFIKENGLEDKIDTVADFVGKTQTFSDAQNIVRYGGTLLYVGTLSNYTTVDAKICIKKRLTVVFNYGGQYEDVVEVLDLIAKKVVRPQVETGSFKDFPKIVQDLHEGKVKSRMALLPSHT